MKQEFKKKQTRCQEKQRPERVARHGDVACHVDINDNHGNHDQNAMIEGNAAQSGDSDC